MDVREGFSIVAGVLVLAGLGMIVVHGDKAAPVLATGFYGFANVIKVATFQA